jgi:probable addiction module antidote protein
MKVKMKRSIKYQDVLIKDLKNKDEAIAYLNAALEESQKGDVESQYLFLLALRNVAEAQGGIGKLAKKSHIGRESLYKTLSEKGNPTWNTLITLFGSLGLNLRLVG